MQPLEWKMRPASRERGKLVVLLLMALAAAVVGNALYGLGTGLLGAGLVLAATAEFWLGTTYRIDDKGVTARTGLSPTALEWDQVKSVHIGPLGVKLSPIEGEARPSPFRGVLIRFDGNEEAVKAWVRAKCPDLVAGA